MFEFIPYLSRTDFASVSAFTVSNTVDAQIRALRFQKYSGRISSRANSYLARLVNTKTIDQMKKQTSKYPSTKAMLEDFGIHRPTRTYSEEEKKLLDHLGDLQRNSRKLDYTRRLHAEFREAERNGWFVIFDTVTYSNSNLQESIRNGNSHIRDYCRTIGRRITTHIHGSLTYLAPNPDDIHSDVRRSHRIQDNYKYFVVPEFGSQTGRIHFHILHFCADLPDEWKIDPMRSPDSKNREIAAMKHLWPYGWSTPMTSRYSPTDAWGRLGHHWPRKKDGSPMPTGAIGRVANYLTKYINKSMAEKKKGNFPWRISMTRQFGNQIIRQLIPNLDQAIQYLDGRLDWKLRQVKLPHQILPKKSLLRRYAMKILCAMYDDSQIIQIQRRLPKMRNILKELPAKSVRVMLRFAHRPITFGISMSNQVRASKEGYAYGTWRFKHNKADLVEQIRRNKLLIQKECHNLVTLLDHFAILPSKQIDTGGIYGRSTQSGHSAV